MIKAEDRAYCAGLFEGEGNINFGVTNIKQRSPSRAISLVIRMTDKEPLDLFNDLIGFGNVTGPYNNGDKNKNIYCYKVTGYERVQFTVCQIWQWLSPRRKELIALALTDFKAFEITPRKSRTWRSVVS